MTIQIALLRGINVGGNNKIKMADLRKALEAAGLSRVQTYIQSGNVLFESDLEESALRGLIEQTIEKEFGLSIATIIRTSAELKAIAEGCPFSREEIEAAEALTDAEHLYVAMLLEEPRADRVEKLKAYDFKDDRYRIAGRDVYLLFGESVRNSKLADQLLRQLAPATVRNWKTLSKLVALAGEMESAK
ncbi:DUF1697 domain-containing protein [Paenibacillus arenilitoris]|uniref:DUF1697 domain-containing protein n=1 Tax=Paenibacillus arenilitoris TaxID=2772299 RepID=A0A927CIN7_9BACL|nr:DUF1697 domain-containing protein [Paenibacillus arenilitoris]MBD2867338.1 DUF1697 domain-containing protein [Paenibacillus arenilitoris]